MPEPRPMRYLPWCLAVLFALLAALLALRPLGADRSASHVDEPTSQDTPGSSAREVGDEAPESLHLCRRCAERLASTKAGLEACRAEESPAPDAGRSPTEALACLADPEVRGVVEARVDEAMAGCVEAEARRRVSVDAEQAERVHRLLGETLDLSDDQSRWLAEYVCTVHELRRGALAELNEDGGPTAEETLARIQGERGEHLEDLERTLGAERYAQLRSIGGLGLLGDVLDCGDSADR